MKQAAPCRAIRGDVISGNSTLPPSQVWGVRYTDTNAAANKLGGIHYHDFPTHPHYHGPGMTYFPGRYVYCKTALWGPRHIAYKGAL